MNDNIYALLWRFDILISKSPSFSIVQYATVNGGVWHSTNPTKADLNMYIIHASLALYMLCFYYMHEFIYCNLFMYMYFCILLWKKYTCNLTACILLFYVYIYIWTYSTKMLARLTSWYRVCVSTDPSNKNEKEVQIGIKNIEICWKLLISISHYPHFNINDSF